MGDLNASIGSDCIAHRGTIGPVCCGSASDNASRPLDFCASNDLRIGSSSFPRKRIHQLTWYSNVGVTRKVLDHVIISRRWFSCMTSCRVFRSSQLGSSRHSPSHCVCVQLLPSALTLTPLITKPLPKYVVEVHNRYALLQNLDPGDQNIDDAWETFKCAVHESASKIFVKPHAPKKPWISMPTPGYFLGIIRHGPMPLKFDGPFL